MYQYGLYTRSGVYEARLSPFSPLANRSRWFRRTRRRNMRGKSVVFFLALALGTSVAFAQAPGGLRGTIKDTQGGLLPGVTVTAASPDALAPAVAITAADGT